jgi:hypothetical protein
LWRMKKKLIKKKIHKVTFLKLNSDWVAIIWYKSGISQLLLLMMARSAESQSIVFFVKLNQVNTLFLLS